MLRLVKLALAASGLGIVGLACGCASMHKDHAQKLSSNDVPARVMDPVKARFPGAQVQNVEREKENGQVVYDFELTQNGRKYETDVREDGTMLEVEKQVDQSNVPPAVMSTVRSKYPDATVKEIMEVNKVENGKETPQKYEITLTTSGGKEKEVTTALDGGDVKEEAEEGGNK